VFETTLGNPSWIDASVVPHVPDAELGELGRVHEVKAQQPPGKGADVQATAQIATPKPPVKVLLSNSKHLPRDV